MPLIKPPPPKWQNTSIITLLPFLFGSHHQHYHIQNNYYYYYYYNYYCYHHHYYWQQISQPLLNNKTVLLLVTEFCFIKTDPRRVIINKSWSWGQVFYSFLNEVYICRARARSSCNIAFGTGSRYGVSLMHRMGAAPSCLQLVKVCLLKLQWSVERTYFIVIKGTVILIGLTVNNAIAVIYKSAVTHYSPLNNLQLFMCIFHLLQVYNMHVH